MVRIRGRKLSRNARRWSGEGGPREGGRGRKLGRTSVCYEWSREGGMEGWVCRCLDHRSGGVGRFWWVGDGTSSETKQGTGDGDFWMLETGVECGVCGSDIVLCLLSRFRVPVECVAVYVSVGRETRLSGRLGLVHGGVLCVLGSDGKEGGEAYEGRLNGGYGSSVCRARRVHAQSSTDVSDTRLHSEWSGRRG